MLQPNGSASLPMDLQCRHRNRKRGCCVLQQSRFGFSDAQKVRFGDQPLKRLRMMLWNRSRSQLKLKKSVQELPESAGSDISGAATP